MHNGITFDVGGSGDGSGDAYLEALETQVDEEEWATAYAQELALRTKESGSGILTITREQALGALVAEQNDPRLKLFSGPIRRGDGVRRD